MFIFEYSIGEIWRQFSEGSKGFWCSFWNINIANTSWQLTNAWSDISQGKITYLKEKIELECGKNIDKTHLERSGQEYSFNEITEIFLIVSCKIYSCYTNSYNGIINHMSDDPLC